jgi:hypothetical protein
MTLQTSRRSWPAVASTAIIAMIATLTVTESALAQGIPNPLVRPQRGAETVPTQQPRSAAPSTGGQTQRGATAAPPASRGATGGGRTGGEGLPAEDQGAGETVAETLAGLYVSAVIGDRAVLRSLDVLTVRIQRRCRRRRRCGRWIRWRRTQQRCGSALAGLPRAQRRGDVAVRPFAGAGAGA